jgi:hypothetical protein
MTTAVDIDQVSAFATAVRRHLSDLGPDTLDDLTDGLEADLADKLADGEALGDPAAYAAELRAASGVSPATRPSVADDVRENLADLRAKTQPLLAQPAIAAVVAFFVSLRPVWWLARGILLFALLNTHRQLSAIPNDPLQMLLIVALVLASVQWGRGRWLPWKWSRPTLYVASAIAVLMAPVVVGVTQSQLREWWWTPEEYVYTGVTLDGQQVTNIFAFDAGGQPLTDVQLYDQDGNPLSLANQETDYIEQWNPEGDYSFLVPNDNVTGRKGWNVFPLEASSEELSWEAGGGTYVDEVTPPFTSVQQLLGYEPAAADDDPQP